MSDLEWFSNIKAIWYDIGDTLIDVNPIVNRSTRVAVNLLLEDGINIDLASFRSVFSEEDRKYSIPHANHLYSNLQIVSSTFRSLDLPVSLSLTGRFLSCYRESVRDCLVYNQNLFNYLSLIKKSGYLIGIISDGTTIEQVEILTRLGIISLFDQIAISEDVGYEKPNHQIFEKCFSDLDVEPWEALIVGDSYERDIIGAKINGASAALIQGTISSVTTSCADIIINNVYELIPVISSNK